MAEDSKRTVVCLWNEWDPDTPVVMWLCNEAAKFALCYGPEYS
jgi:hypothetical protein